MLTMLPLTTMGRWPVSTEPDADGYPQTYIPSKIGVYAEMAYPPGGAPWELKKYALRRYIDEDRRLQRETLENYEEPEVNEKIEA